MCLYPKKIKNRKYTATDKNGGLIPDLPIIDNSGIVPIYDQRITEIEVPCGQCIECRKTKARDWQVRLNEEIKDWKYKYFVTLTFAPNELEQLHLKTRLTQCNAICEYAVRHMLERWRKTYKKSLKHWLITELGHEGTERIHLHGLFFTNEELIFSEVDEHGLRRWNYWKYGSVYIGEYVNNRTINYISKYITKIDEKNKDFKSKIMASPGIGRRYIDNIYQKPVYKPGKAQDYYRLNTGVKVKLPKYYKNKLYNEDERELIWREFLDKEKISIMGVEHSQRSVPKEVINDIRDINREKNKFLGYGDDTQEWRKKEYNITRNMLLQVQRLKGQREMLQGLIKKQVASIEQVNQYYKICEKLKIIEKK